MYFWVNYYGCKGNILGKLFGMPSGDSWLAYRVTDWGFISRNYIAWPIFFLINVFIALKGTHFYLPSLKLVLCSMAAVKRLPVHQPIVQFIFSFLVLWDQREYSENLEIHDCFTHILDRSLTIWIPFWFISVFKSTAFLKFAKLQYGSSGFRCRVIAGSLMRLY